MEERDIRQDKEIKEFELQKELKHLPSLIWYYHNNYQQAKSIAQECKAKYDYIQDKVFLEILRTKTEEEGKKPTDKVLTALLSQDERVIQANEEYFTAEKRKNETFVCTQVIDCKASALKQLVELRKTEHFNTDMTVDLEATSEGTVSQKIRNKYERQN